MATRRTKHIGEHSATCPVCITRAEKESLFGRNQTLATSNKYESAHTKAINRRKREETMHSLGLTKVKGALGGIYWE